MDNNTKALMHAYATELGWIEEKLMIAYHTKDAGELTRDRLSKIILDVRHMRGSAERIAGMEAECTT